MDALAMTRFVQRLHASFGAPYTAGESDRLLLERFLAARDQDAFAALVSRHGRCVLAACRHVLADPADVDDAFQATFLVLFQKADGLIGEESIGRWLYAVAHRVAVRARHNATRRRARETAAGRQRPFDAAAPDLSWREACAALHEELDRLPDRYRLPLLLCYLEGQSRDEAARNLGWTPGAVKGRLERGRRALANRLKRRGITLSAGLLAATTGTTAKAVGLPGDLIERTARAVAGGASRSVRTLARLAFPGTLAGKRAVASALLLTVLLGIGTGWFAAAGAAREEPPVADKASAPAVQKPETRTVSGSVLDPDGKPVAGAKLFVAGDDVIQTFAEHVSSLNSRDVRTAATAGADGRFTAAVELPRTFFLKPHLIAYAPGFGVNWAEFDARAAKPNGELTIRLTRDVPITGRVINTEGRPLPGVSVSVTVIQKPLGDKLDDYLATWKRQVSAALSRPLEQLSVPLARITGAVTTDRDGRFTLRGAGAERIVVVSIRGGGIARAAPYVVTRPGFDPKPYNEYLLRPENSTLRPTNHFQGLFAPDFTFVAEPGRQLTGEVSDAGTGRPIAGCRVMAFGGPGDVVDGETDERGRYRIDGVPKDRVRYLLGVFPPQGSDYLPPKWPEAPDSEGYAPVRLDAKLAKGSVVTGRVVDKKTGKGVRAGVRFVPLPGNKYYGTKPEYSGYPYDRTSRETDVEGRFRLVTLPGAGIVMAKVFAGENVNGNESLNAYRAATPDPARKELFQRSGSSWQVIGGRSYYEFLIGENAVKVVDVKEAGETAVDLSVDPGATVQLVVQDDKGQPLAGARVDPIAEVPRWTYRLTESTATVYALDPDRPRRLVLYHPERRLAGTVTIEGGQKEPVVVRLGPLARVTGRLLGTDGQPLAGATAEAVLVGSPGRDLYRTVGPGGPPGITDKDGNFTLDGVIPGVAFNLEYRKGQKFYAAKGRGVPRPLKAGETRDVGVQTVGQ